MKVAILARRHCIRSQNFFYKSKYYAFYRLTSGIENIRNHFSSWNWIFGKTPRFSIKRPIDGGKNELEIQVNQGCVEKVLLRQSGLGDTDSEIWTALLCNKNLDRNLYENICKNDHHLSDRNANMVLKALISNMCSITM